MGGERDAPGGEARGGGVYVGDFVGGVKHGKGVLTTTGIGFLREQEVYDGQWKAGVRDGKGRMEFFNGITYAGEWVGGAIQGEGTLTGVDGEMLFTGRFVKGLPAYACMVCE
jgi:hypothetical protein